MTDTLFGFPVKIVDKIDGLPDKPHIRFGTGLTPDEVRAEIAADAALREALKDDLPGRWDHVGYWGKRSPFWSEFYAE